MAPATGSAARCTHSSAASALADLRPAALEAARVATGVCRGFTRGASQQPLRRCLEARHDAWMMDLSEAYWDELVAW